MQAPADFARLKLFHLLFLERISGQSMSLVGYVLSALSGVRIFCSARSRVSQSPALRRLWILPDLPVLRGS
jgi:hypothetical protein